MRLLGGYYRRGETSAWCEAAALSRPDEWVTSWYAAALACSEDTPAEWVTEPAPVNRDDEFCYTLSAELDSRKLVGPERVEPEAWRDPGWLRRYGAVRHALPWAHDLTEEVTLTQMLPQE